MKVIFYIQMICLLLLFNRTLVCKSETRDKPRVIVTTDGEIDDRSSMVRFLMYASDYDIEGIVQVNGVQKSGHSSEKWIEKLIECYRISLPNLKIHNQDYPEADSLLNVLAVGNEMAEDLYTPPPLLSNSEGAQLIIKTLLDNDPRPVHILAWGGANTQANALWQIKENYSDADWKKAVSKARLYCIWYQDGGGKWIENHLPEVFIYESGAPNRDGAWRYVWDYMSVDYYFKNRLSKNSKELQTIMDKDWLQSNIKLGHGPLCAAYPQEYTSEGDTPSFLALIDNGLNQDLDYTLGGWGGRPVFVKGNHLQDGADFNRFGEKDTHYVFQRWLPAIQNDWAARADWCIKDNYWAANHHPIIQFKEEVNTTIAVGDTIVVDASASIDPDGDSLLYYWWQYKEGGTVISNITINKYSKNVISFVVPNEAGKHLQLILEVSDNGIPSLKRYKRILFKIISKN